MSDKDRREAKSKLKLNALGHSYNDMYFFIIPFLLPLFREEFGINYVQSGLILTVHVALRSIFSLVFGYFGDKYEKKVIIASGFICSSIFLGSLIWMNNIHTLSLIHISEPTRLGMISYAVFCLTKKKKT